jgi:hypothetical protein
MGNGSRSNRSRVSVARGGSTEPHSKWRTRWRGLGAGGTKTDLAPADLGTNAPYQLTTGGAVVTTMWAPVDAGGANVEMPLLRTARFSLRSLVAWVVHTIGVAPLIARSRMYEPHSGAGGDAASLERQVNRLVTERGALFDKAGASFGLSNVEQQRLGTIEHELDECFLARRRLRAERDARRFDRDRPLLPRMVRRPPTP